MELETNQVPKMSAIFENWHCYDDDTIAFVKEDQVDKMIQILNSYKKDLYFTYEMEEVGQLPFLDFHLTRIESNKH